MPKREVFSAAIFGREVEAVSMTFAEIKELYENGRIGENDRLFSLEGVQEIAFAAFKGGWFNCVLQRNPKSKWSAETGARQARVFIKEAF